MRQGRLARQNIDLPVASGVLLKGTRFSAPLAAATDGPAVGWLLLFLHPFSKLGGSGGLLHGLAEATVLALAASLASEAVAAGSAAAESVEAVVYNARGVGGSGGASTWLLGDETRDVVTVCDHLMASQPAPRRLVIVGSSAGAVAGGSALPALCLRQPRALHAYVAIGYPFGWTASVLFGSHYHAVFVPATTTLPKLFLVGDEDGFTSPSQLVAMVARADKAAGTASGNAAPQTQTASAEPRLVTAGTAAAASNPPPKDGDGIVFRARFLPVAVAVVPRLAHFGIETRQPRTAAELIARFLVPPASCANEDGTQPRGA